MVPAGEDLGSEGVGFQRSELEGLWLYGFFVCLFCLFVFEGGGVALQVVGPWRFRLQAFLGLRV